MTIQEIICEQCGLCLRECARLTKAISLADQGVKIDLELCMTCGHCMAVCPSDAMDNPLSPRQELMAPLPTPEQATMFLRSARSVRYYKPDLVPRETMRRLLDIGRYPQTGVNSQGVSYLVLEGREKIVALNQLFCQTLESLLPSHPEFSRLKEVMIMQRRNKEDKIFRDASQLIVALTDHDLAWGRQNAQFSLTFIALLAPTLGLGTCWAGYFETLATNDAFSAPFLEFLQVPENKRIRGAMMVGVPDVEFRRLVARNPLEMDWR